MTTIFVVATGSSNQSKPSDWTATNSFEVIGGGGAGAGGNSFNGGAGGGGGGYSKITNFASAAATFYFSVGTGGSGVAGGNGGVGSTTWARLDGTNSQPTTTSQRVVATGGGAGLRGTQSTGGAGG